MKIRWHSFAIFLLPVLWTGQQAWATPKNNVTIQIFELFRLNSNVEYEMALTGDSTLAARCALLNNYDALGLSFQGFGVGVSYRLYPVSEGKAPQGFFAGPAGEIKFLNAPTIGPSAFYYSAGIELGYRWLLGEVTPLVIVPSLALIYKNGSISDNRPLEGIGFGAQLGLGLGLAFD